MPSGGRTGLSGGAVAANGELVLSLERMRTVEIDPVTRVAVVQPGALNAEVKAAANDVTLPVEQDGAAVELRRWFPR